MNSMCARGSFLAGLRREKQKLHLSPGSQGEPKRGINSSLSPNSHLILRENS